MSEHQSHERMAGGKPAASVSSAPAGSRAPESSEVVARLPDIGALERDLERDLPAGGRRGRVLNARLAMPLLMGAGLVLLAVALAPFLFGKKGSSEVAELDGWEADAQSTGAEQPSDARQPEPAPKWDAASTQSVNASPAQWAPQGQVEPATSAAGWPQTGTGGVQPAQPAGSPAWPQWPSAPSRSSGAAPSAQGPVSTPPQPAPWNAAPPTASVPASGATWNQQPSNEYRSWEGSAAESAVTPVDPTPWVASAQTGADSAAGSASAPSVQPTGSDPSFGAGSPYGGEPRYASPSTGYYRSYDTAAAQPSAAHWAESTAGYEAPQAAANRSLALDQQTQPAAADYPPSDQSGAASWPGASSSYAGQTSLNTQNWPSTTAGDSPYPSTASPAAAQTAPAATYPNSASYADSSSYPNAASYANPNAASYANTATYPSSGYPNAASSSATDGYGTPTSWQSEQSANSYPRTASRPMPAYPAGTYPSTGSSGTGSLYGGYPTAGSSYGSYSAPPATEAGWQEPSWGGQPQSSISGGQPSSWSGSAPASPSVGYPSTGTYRSYPPANPYGSSSQYQYPATSSSYPAAGYPAASGSASAGASYGYTTGAANPYPTASSPANWPAQR